MPTTRRNPSQQRVRYAVVGLGWIAQDAVLPAFAHASENSDLVALVSDDPVKLDVLGRKHGVTSLYSYDEYDDCLSNADVDAVYIALPNDQHEDYARRAAERGVHVLCEKPLAVDERQCERMIAACRRHRVKLMTAYRLHFEKANLHAIDLIRKGTIGEPRVMMSTFTQQVDPDNSRLDANLGGEVAVGDEIRVEPR